MDRFLGKFFESFAWGSDGSMFMWTIMIIGAFAIAIGFERVYYIMVRSNVNAVKFIVFKG